MLAFKFLAAGAVAPFTMARWPRPKADGPGEPVVAPPGDLARRGVHACRLEDLAYWPDEELWLVDLGEPVQAGRYGLAAATGRLLRRVEAWDGSAARAYSAACAWRARDLAAAALEVAGLAPDAAALRACPDLAGLQERAAAIAGAAPPEEPRGLAAYVAGAALRAQQGRLPEAALQHAHLGAALAGGEAGAAAERAWQSRWLTERLGLEALASRWRAPPAP